MTKSTLLASVVAFTGIAAVTRPVSAQALTATANEDRGLPASVASAAARSQAHRQLRTEYDGPTRPLLRRQQQQQQRVLQQEVAQVLAASGDSEVLDFKEALLAQTQLAEETLEDPQVTAEDAAALAKEDCAIYIGRGSYIYINLQ